MLTVEDFVLWKKR